MQGKVCVITGATAGIGQVAATELARRGAHVVIVGRSAEKCAATQAQIRSASPSAAVDTLVADLSSLAETKRLAGQVARTLSPDRRAPEQCRRDVLETDRERRRHREDVRPQPPFVFRADESACCRCSSRARRPGSSTSRPMPTRVCPFNFDDIQFKQKYSGWKAYQQSKLANILFTYELARRIEGTGVTANTLHPGFVRTNFLEAFNDAPAGWLFKKIGGLIALSPEQGARTSIYLASSPEVAGVSGRYFVKEKPVVSSPQSRDQAAAERLWKLSVEMTGVGGA